jgi:23S rRNA (guanine745-N1)-methyltransferase
LECDGRTWQCARRHSYDIARAGYINLLQPQDRRSLDAGDRRDAIDARARLLARGVGASIVRGFVDLASRLATKGALVVDLGSGSGEVLASLAARTAIVGVGVDLSTAAAEHAARQFPELTWVVTNADRRVPLLDRSVDLVLSMHGRRNPEECARVLTHDGRVLVGMPAADDLVELRELVQGQRVTRQRTQAVVAEHESSFCVVEQIQLRERHQLDRDQLNDLLRGTYRGERNARTERLESIDALVVTLASDVLVMARR